MAKVAEPNTPYCGSFTQGTLGGFTSENPPLSYTLNGAIATVSDATGVLGTVDLTGRLAPEEDIAASPGVDYCGGKPKAVLKWSSGSVTTENTPISYAKNFLSGELAPTGETITSGQITYPASSGPIGHSAPSGYAIVGGDDSGSSWAFFSDPNQPPGLQTQVPGSTGIQAYIEQKISESESGYITSISVIYDSFYGDNFGTIYINWTYRKLEPVDEQKCLLINGQLTCFDKDIQSWTTVYNSGSSIKVDWGAGDIDYLSGSSWNLDTQQAKASWAVYYRRAVSNSYKSVFCDWCDFAGAPRGSGLGSAWTARCSPSWPDFPTGVPPQVFSEGFYVNDPNAVFQVQGVSSFVSCSGALLTYHGLNFTSNLSPEGNFVAVNYALGYVLESFKWRMLSRTGSPITWTVESDTGQTSQRTQLEGPFLTLEGGGDPFCILTITYTDGTAEELTYPECPTVEAAPATTYLLEVNDATGQIASREYNTEPTNFRVTCYDYDIGEVTYACEGECPSGTEFQCRCEATNTLMCYGWDPNNPDVFKPLYTTSITSG